ncbi:MAG: hypothetical protein ABSG25_13345 [Bryobacteraceae bacterium]
MAKTVALFLLCVSWLAAAPASTVSVDEAGTRVILQNRQSAVSLALTNPAGQAVPAEVQLAWLDTDGVEQATVERKIVAAPGKSEPLIPLPLPDKPNQQQMWYRLRYRVRAGGGESAGIIALSQICGFCYAQAGRGRAREGQFRY